ncbi:MAG TPA: hypothetical protein VHY20_16115, partial [Pirellulales bacterium]|nr:hypothetical protein [Pirellulales bacterium]
FLLVDTFCATTVIGLFFALSYRFAPQIQGWWDEIRKAEIALTVTVVVAVVAVVIFFYVRHRRHLKAGADEHAACKTSVHENDQTTSEKKSVA